MEKVLLILGASSDIGIDYLSRYHSNYDHVIAQYCTNGNELEKFHEKIGNKIDLYKVNLLDESEVALFLSKIREKNRIPQFIIFLPAQKTQLLRIEETESQLLIDAMMLQVVSSFAIVKYFVPDMFSEGWGRICFMLSSVTEQVVTYNLPYVVSKYALLGEMKALALELASKSILVNAVSPSMVDTKYIAEVSDFVKKKKISASPMKRLVEKSEISRTIEFLISEENTYITGENIVISGGSVIP